VLVRRSLQWSLKCLPVTRTMRNAGLFSPVPEGKGPAASWADNAIGGIDGMGIAYVVTSSSNDIYIYDQDVASGTWLPQGNVVPAGLNPSAVLQASAPITLNPPKLANRDSSDVLRSRPPIYTGSGRDSGRPGRRYRLTFWIGRNRTCCDGALPWWSGISVIRSQLRFEYVGKFNAPVLWRFSTLMAARTQAH